MFLYICPILITNTNIMKTYLKTSDIKFYTAYAAFDHTNLTSASVARGSFDFGTTYDDLGHLLDKIKSYIVDGWEICTREEFNAFYMGESKLLNDITKEL